MHCELVIPSLFAAPRALRLPALELLLARGRSSSEPSQSLERWLADAFGLGDALPAGALTLLAGGGEPGESSWARADPVHLRLMRERLVLVPAAAFAISQLEAEALCASLNHHFKGVLELHPLEPQRWCARLDEAFVIEAAAPLEEAGRDVGLGTARAGAAGRLHAVLNEVQMLLHAHPVNEAREERGEPAINSLWLWGAGRLPAVAPAHWQGVLADDPVALGLARSAGARRRLLPESAAAWLERAPDDGRHLVVLDALRVPLALAQEPEYRERLAALEREWFAPLLAALRAGRIGMLSVHVPDAEPGASFETVRGDLRRFWRRPRAIEHYA